MKFVEWECRFSGIAHFEGKKDNRKQIAKEHVGSSHCPPDGEGRPTVLNLRCSASYPTHWKVVAFHFCLLNFAWVWASTYTCLRLQNLCVVASLPVWPTVTRATSLKTLYLSCSIWGKLFFPFKIDYIVSITVRGIDLLVDIEINKIHKCKYFDIFFYMPTLGVWQIMQKSPASVSLALMLMRSCELIRGKL